MQSERARVHFPLYCEGDKISRHSILHPFPLEMSWRFLFWQFPFHPTEPQNLKLWLRKNKSQSSSSLTSPKIKKKSMQCTHGRDRQAAGEEWELCHLLIKGCSRFYWGPREAVSSFKAWPRLWHIWVICSTLGLLDLAPDQLLGNTQLTSSFLSGKNLLSLSMHETDINCIC